MTRRMAAACDAAGVACVALLRFCHEGNNAPDAMLLARETNRFLDIVACKEGGDGGAATAVWTTPMSWEMLFSGPQMPAEMHF